MQTQEEYTQEEVTSKIQEYEQKVLDIPQLNKEKFMRGMKWVYQFVGLPEPRVVFADSPLSAQYIANLIIYGVIQPEDGMDFLGVSLSDLEGQIKSSGHEKEIVYYDFSKYLHVIDYGLAAYLDIKEKKYGISDSQIRLRDLITSGQFDAIEFNDLVIVVRFPNRLKIERTSNQDRHHSLDGPSIAWADGFREYNLWGVEFQEDMYGRIISGEITAKEVSKIQNIDQRMAALKALGAEKVLRDLDATLVHVSQRGNYLYEIKEGFDRTQYALRYYCSSTGREYVSHVDPLIAEKTRNADACMAWKHGLTPEQYEALSPTREA